MPKSINLVQIQHYKAHYQQIYLRANRRAKPVLRRHLLKLTRQIQRLQGNSQVTY